MLKLAELWETIGDPTEKKVKCNVCAHHCTISQGKRGFCLIRKNIDGKLYIITYGSLISRGTVDPIEKKPLHHFYPNSNAFSIASIGCNLRCKHCQNWEISKSFPDEEGNFAEFSERDRNDLGARTFALTQMTPEEVVTRAKREKCEVIAYTYNEPLISYEFVRDTSLLAHEAGIKNVLVTGGYSSDEANKEYVKFIDAANVDIKGFTDKFYQKLIGIPSLQPVLNTCEYFKNNGMHVEITNLIIPEENDNLDEIQALAEWVRDHLGVETPLHFSAYHPSYRIDRPRTPSKILTDAWNIAKKIGLKYVFMGNVFSDVGGNTYCPKCNALLIERKGYIVENKGLTSENTCMKCGTKIEIIGEFCKHQRSFF
ncbi:MAG: AmmeMemoRadiSam system radical SAM enzyme [Promethearchaeota archaeon]